MFVDVSRTAVDTRAEILVEYGKKILLERKCAMPMTTALSSKGQIVLPQKLRKSLSLAEGTLFVVFSDNDNILLKPIRIPKISNFDRVLQQARSWAKDVGLEESDIADAVKAVRRRKCA